MPRPWISAALWAILAAPARAADVEVWSRHEIVLESRTERADPLREVQVTVDLDGPDGKKESVAAFWDGKKTWRARVMPGAPGSWTWTSHASDEKDTGLHDRRGEFRCVPGAGRNPLQKHGRLRVAASGLHLEHADGTPFFWLACTAWNGALRADAAGWKEYLTDRAAKKFTVIQFVTTQWRAAEKDREGRVAFEYSAPGDAGGAAGGKLKIVPEFFQRLDRMVDAVNAHGLAASPVVLWAIQDPTGRSPGASLPDEEATLLASYIVARYGGHHVLWALGGDGDYQGPKAERWKKIGRIAFSDTEASVVTMHPRGQSWIGEEFRGEKWFDFIGYQSGHGDNDLALDWLAKGPPRKAWDRQPLRPVINMEPNYEGHLAYQSLKPITDFMVRRAAYWSLLAGATAGVTYGAHGVWNFGEKKELPLEHPDSGIALSFREAMALPGSTQMKHLRSLFDSLQWWRLRPAEELLPSQPGNIAVRRYVAASRSETGDLAVIYIPEDREIALATRKLAASLESRWFDPRTGESKAIGPVQYENQAKFETPAEGDWVLVMERKK